MGSVVLHRFHLEEYRFDEIWSFGLKQHRHLTQFERVREDIGDLWLHVAFELRLKLFVVIVPGKRTGEHLRPLFLVIHHRSDGQIPILTSGDYPAYRDALLWEYGHVAPVDNSGRPEPPAQQPTGIW